MISKSIKVWSDPVSNFTLEIRYEDLDHYLYDTQFKTLEASELTVALKVHKIAPFSTEQVWSRLQGVLPKFKFKRLLVERCLPGIVILAVKQLHFEILDLQPVRTKWNEVSLCALSRTLRVNNQVGSLRLVGFECWQLGFLFSDMSGNGVEELRFDVVDHKTSSLMALRNNMIANLNKVSKLEIKLDEVPSESHSKTIADVIENLSSLTDLTLAQTVSTHYVRSVDLALKKAFAMHVDLLSNSKYRGQLRLNVKANTVPNWHEFPLPILFQSLDRFATKCLIMNVNIHEVNWDDVIHQLSKLPTKWRKVRRFELNISKNLHANVIESLANILHRLDFSELTLDVQYDIKFKPILIPKFISQTTLVSLRFPNWDRLDAELYELSKQRLQSYENFLKTMRALVVVRRFRRSDLNRLPRDIFNLVVMAMLRTKVEPEWLQL